MQPYRIDEVLDIDVNGDRQNLHIRGTDPANPVVLFVHGGPGVCDRSWVMPKQSAHLADACRNRQALLTKANVRTMASYKNSKCYQHDPHYQRITSTNRGQFRTCSSFVIPLF